MDATTARIYVGTYGKYNNGNLNGEWVDLDNFSTKDDFLEYCAEIHADEPDAEFMFQDYEGFPSSLYSESGIDDELFDYLAMDDDERELLEAYNNCFGEGYGDLRTAQDASYGKHDSEQDFAENILDECGDLASIPENLRYYFDYEKYANDLFINDFTRDDESGYVFSRA